MAAFSSPEDLLAYCIISQGREPGPSEYWNAACEFMEEKYKYEAQNHKTDLTETVKHLNRFQILKQT